MRLLTYLRAAPTFILQCVLTLLEFNKLLSYDRKDRHDFRVHPFV